MGMSPRSSGLHLPAETSWTIADRKEECSSNWQPEAGGFAAGSGVRTG